MAAYAALLSLELVIDQILPTVQGYTLFPLKKNFWKRLCSCKTDYVLLCTKEQLKSLHEDVLFLQKVFEEFPQKCITLESPIRLVAHQLEDIIDSSISGPPYMYFASKVKDLRWKHMYYAFGTCTQQFDSIVEEAKEMIKKCEIEDMSRGDSSTAGTSSRGSRPGKETMVGLDEDLIEILDRATGHARGLQFIPIVGMGGIGKTTLARHLYEHPLIVRHFDVRSWITVSQEYDVQKVLLGLLKCEGDKGGEDVESLIVRLYQSLKYRRFLIVLDDMWDAKVWDNVMRAFPNEDNGSRIVITTRLLKVVQEVNSSSAIHHVRFLNEDQSWSLICEKMYGQDGCPPQLEKLGKSIARNCRGLPLVIVAIAGLLKVNNTQAYWKEIARNVSEAAAATSDDHLDRILYLSYDNLPHHLKACFLYMGVFPEDFEIPRDQLVELWVAEGFIKSNSPKSMEEVAEEYLEDLLRRSLVLVSNPWYANDTTSDDYFKIHDVLRELCLRKAQQENFLKHCTGKCVEENKFSGILKGQRRIIVHNNSCLKFNPNSMHNSPLRSIRFVGDRTTTSLLPFISHFKLLRKVYDLRVGLEDLSSDSAIFELIHLKYLSISCVKDVSPDDGKLHIHGSIVKLQNLQTLRLDYYGSMIVMPLNFWKMQKLRHLILANVGGWLIPDVEHNSICSGLRCLQTLSLVTNFKFTKDAVERLQNLKRLRVRYYSGGVKCEDFGLNNLVYLQRLQDLFFILDCSSEHCLLTNFSFPHNLRKLTLRGCILSCEKMSDIGSLKNLEVLSLVGCSFVGGEWEPIEGEFHRLRYLHMDNIEIQEWNAEDTDFPCLEELCIEDCSIEIPESIGDIPTLNKLTIEPYCSKNTVESARRIQEEQLSNGNDQLQVIIMERPS